MSVVSLGQVFRFDRGVGGGPEARATDNGPRTTDNGPRTKDLRPFAVFVIALAALFALRWAALDTPYFWDEVGYYVPAAVSMYRNSLYPIPDLTIAQSYTPLLPLVLAIGWMVAGFSIAVARIVVFLFGAAALVYTYKLGRELWSESVGIAAAALTLVFPIFLGQAGFAQPEVPLALFTVAATYHLVRGEAGKHAAAVALLVMTKWTAVIAIPVFALYALSGMSSWRDWREAVRRLLPYVPAVVLLGAWFAFFYYEVGTLTSPDARYAQVNLWDNLTPKALAFRAGVRFAQLFVDEFTWLLSVPAIVAGAMLLLKTGEARATLARRDARASLLMLGLCAIYIAFLTVSGFLLPRYFVPVCPFVALLGAAALFRLLPRSAAIAYVACVCVLMYLTWLGRFDEAGPPMLDQRPAYMDFAKAHVQAARFVEEHYPDARIAATWPTRDELTQPFLGYVSRKRETILLETSEGATLDPASFDLLFEAPVPRNPNPARDLAERLGLVEVARFEVNGQRVVVWGK